jgi:hypothetical protein
MIKASTTPTSPANNDCGLPGILGKACASATSAATGAVQTSLSDLGRIENDIADKLAGALGIHQFYSFHVMDICRGNFSPNTTAAGATWNVTNCTEPLKTGMYIFINLVNEILD